MEQVPLFPNAWPTAQPEAQEAQPATPKPRAYRIPLARVCMVKEASLSFGDQLSGSAACAALLHDLAKDEVCENFWAIALDARRRPMAVVKVSTGTLTQSFAHPREVFRVALLANAAGLIVAHNHPSGDPTPSPEDHAVTRRLREAGELLAIPMLDHLIIGSEGRHFSYSDAGWPR